MKDIESEAREFWAEKERERGGTIGFYTFATYLGMSDDRAVSLGGLLYTVNGKIYFEDFEKENWLLKLVNKKQKWGKTEFSVRTEDISCIRVVNRGSAMSCTGGRLSGEETKPLSPFMRIFTKPVAQLLLHNGSSLFFEIMRLGDFIKAVEAPAG